MHENLIAEARERLNTAKDIINDLHTERLEYRSEYLPLIDAADDGIALADALEAAIGDLSGHCEYCAFRNDCAKHDNNGSSAGFTWWTDCEDWKWWFESDQENGGAE